MRNYIEVIGLHGKLFLINKSEISYLEEMNANESQLKTKITLKDYACISCIETIDVIKNLLQGHSGEFFEVRKDDKDTDKDAS